MRYPWFLTLLSLALCACQHHQTNAGNDGDAGAWPSYNDFSPGIVVDDIAQHMKVLSSDTLLGRTVGGASEQRTIDYIIQQYKRIGLEPGNDGRWLQTVPYVSATLLHADETTLDVHSESGSTTLAFGQDVVVGTLDEQAHSAFTASPVVFVGYGIDAPGEHWNDYADADVKGKTVIILVNDPGWANQDPALFHGREYTYFGRWNYKFEEAAREGAAAAFIVHDTQAAGYGWDSVRTSWSGARLDLPKREEGTPRLPVAGWLTTDAARRLFAQAGADFDALKRQAGQRGFTAVPLHATLDTRFDSSIAHGESHNVVARITGSRRPDETIVYSAHWDHIPAPGEPPHGTVDNATGIAGLLEIAEAFAHRAPKSHRTVLFIATTLDENGLIGSRYYVQHPLVPLAHTVADINLDMLPVNGPASALAVIGFGQSQLDDYLADAAHAQRRRVTADVAPEKGFFFRSDQLSFARAGVPVLYARSAATQPDAAPSAGDTIAAHGRYDPDWDLSGTVEDVRALFMVGSRLSMEDTFPQWKPGSDYHRPESMRGL
ncbi:Zn-dependent amino-or carboxypeptidase, M28 family [Dyella jiangningensis]|uniref:M28 family peptidase n=1 Tax=Dyella sp. AtDHG13 TaxID=1938897 RepID=UPI000889B1D2|nr:M28 family peptidase [Dyella sp. AtDHG13]PXV58335.1 Zn-dependent M28 family amino/carboxypeptidase [Dyella sp. AtDHG13]SDK06694.1 Zn-dependent amino-or carboxypeptidase, M28 family [Dyella jiangningensis]